MAGSVRNRSAPVPIPSTRRPARSRPLSPALIVWGLAAVIVAGALLLMLPAAADDGRVTDPLTALFTATSAVCTTGLVVVDTHDHYSFFGQAVIVLLMQVGGLGFLTSSTLVLLVAGRRLSLRDEVLVQESLGEGGLGDVGALVRRIVVFALCVEAAGALLLVPAFWSSGGPLTAAWYGFFHSVSAFTNASFDLMGGMRGFTGLSGDVYLLGVIAALIVVGGLGFTVCADAWHWRRRAGRMSLDHRDVADRRRGRVLGDRGDQPGHARRAAAAAPGS
jgi:trk system potassium uptake protein